jgi:RNA-directed DNA polymerase
MPERATWEHGARIDILPGLKAGDSTLDQWIRLRLRALHLRQWRRGRTIYRELLRLGATPEVAQSVAALSRRWWHNSLSTIHSVLTIAYFDRLGVPRLS